jgi:hypothetical protein
VEDNAVGNMAVYMNITTDEMTKHIWQNITTQETHKIYLPLVGMKNCVLEQTHREK